MDTLEVLQKTDCEAWIGGRYSWKWEAKEMRDSEVVLVRFSGGHICKSQREVREGARVKKN